MRQLLVSTVLVAGAMVAGCQDVPQHKDAWLSYKYGLACGSYSTNSCDMADPDTANLYYKSTGIANPNAYDTNTEADCSTPAGCSLNPNVYTFSSWKSDNGFPAVADAHAIYGNLADLQIGRDMYCAQAALKIACYVTNYGPTPASFSIKYGWHVNGDWPAISSAVNDAVQSHDPFGTVAMIYDPSKAGPNQVAFYAFDGSSNLLANPALDGDGPKNVPRMCMACHGGTYDIASNTVTGASFLPFDVFNFRYPKDPSHTFDAQQESLRKLNALVVATNPNQPIIDLINAMYPNGVANTGSVAVDGYVPPGWSDNSTLYTGVVRPYCRTCHLAQTLSFESSSDFEGNPGLIQSIVCTSHDMPHAQVPFGIGDLGGSTVGFWNDPVAQRDFGKFFKSQGVTSCLPTD
jgi:hypothetical protein